MSDLRRAVLIWNPTSGGGGARRAREVEKFQSFMQARGVQVESWATQGPNEAQILTARAAREGVRDIILSGGDGTFNESLQGFIGAQARLGFWPKGTGNVLAREIGMPRALDKIADALARGRSQKVYVGCATLEQTGARRYFFLMAGIGLDASVVQRVNPLLKKKLGKGAFWLAGLAHLGHWQPRPFTVEIDGVSHTVTFAAVGKASRYGSDLAITPRARMHEPDFEICLISAVSRWRYLALLRYAVRAGVPPGVRDVSFFRATRLRADGDAMDAQVDGEYLGQLPATFEIVPQPVEIIIP
jgi:YegS/Rv2252/BmrU family lipid kinase